MRTATPALVFVRGKKTLSKTKHAKIETMKRWQIKVEKWHTRAKEKARVMGLETVPECHFLVLDKPAGEICQPMVNVAKKLLRLAYGAAMDMRYCAFQKYRVQETKQEIVLPKEGKVLRTLPLDYGTTLERYASGLIVIGIEKGVKLLGQFLDGPHVYECTAQFGTATDTLHLQGKVIEESSYTHITKEFMEEMMETCFTGDIMQAPPIASGVVYQAIPVQVHAFKVIEYDLPRVRFHVRCSERTHVSKLVHDLAHALNSSAHLTELRRSQCGLFSLDGSISGDRKYLNSLEPKQLESHLKHANDVKPGSWPFAPQRARRKAIPRVSPAVIRTE
ncbi:putative tRNA pseudouridine synthase 1 [Porphyridium purpureum]|uniref:tRNA pseudouridine(55) synthase n=1 Tax=Porphyridium purpureum TaxID=35688 RepID=A0A5J4YLR0_PORPP|nr:putative tRNA pseudouridine synthase 1 [Porphyridium purpureum]|eukprot:POR5282..scf244_11